jgi:DNA polymerase-3 subunit alpha
LLFEIYAEDSMNWAPICNYTHYSLLKGFSRPEELAKKCSENGYPACGIADYKSISGAVSFYQSCIEHNVKPIIGCAFDDFTLIAKNKAGWYDLIDLISSLDADDNVPSREAKRIFDNRNLICISPKKYAALGEDAYVESPALAKSYYVSSEDAQLHRILLCSGMKTTLPKVRKEIKSGVAKVWAEKFFDCDDYHVPDSAEIAEILLDCDHQQSLEVTEIIDKCENYNILSKPLLPEFKCPRGESEEAYLRQLCREGWKTLLASRDKLSDPSMEEVYLDRFKQEFEVIKGANLFGYFLIVRDIINYVAEQGWLSGPGRGSAAGCLISYLVGITKIDPIEYNLLFERFYNSGRNTGDYIALPDIDIDVPGKKRDEIILYLKDKYGHDRVSQMITFGRLRGRSALKEIMRVNAACSFGEMNEMTKSIPNEADISDQLEAMDEEDRSIIRWALINNADELRDFCFINSSGELEGTYADFFEQAIRIEGTFKTQGKHAAGVVISREALGRVCPMVSQKSGPEKVAGLEMSDLEALGHVKFDVLGITLLDKIMKIQNLVNNKESSYGQ